MKKILVSMVALLLAISLIVGCAAPAPPAPAPTPTPAPAPAPAPAPTQEVIKWDLYSVYGPIDASRDTWWWVNRFIPEIENLSDGRLEITPYVQGEHPYKNFDSLKLMRDLNPAIADLAMAQAAGEDPRLAVADLVMLYPLDFSTYHEILDKLMADVLTPIISNDYGYTPLITHTWKTQRVGGIDFLVNDWDSLKGKKIRVWNPLLSDWVTMMGGIPVSISIGEVYTSLATGMIDGVITSSASLATVFGDVINSISLVELQYGAYPFCVNNDALDALPADLRQKLLAWAEEKEPEIRMIIHGQGEQITLKGVRENHITIDSPSPSFIAEMRDRCWEGVWQPWIERSGGPGSPAADTFNDVAKLLIEKGLTVPQYNPY